MTRARDVANIDGVLTTKGDIYAATAASTPARLGVGSNGETLVADSSTSTGLRYQVPVNVNPILNSAYQIWQRGTSMAGSGSAYCADRWQAFRAVAGSTYSRQLTNDTTNLPNIQYCLRLSRDSGNTATNAIFASQGFETVNSIPYAGKTVTLSLYARKGANFSATSDLLNVQVITGTGTDQNWISGYTGQAVPISSTATLTTTWQRFTFTGTIATTATELSVSINFAPTGTAGAADYAEITGIQLEVGSVATPFKTYAGTIQGELAACQRYYTRINSINAFAIFGMAETFSTTRAYGYFAYPVVMRTSPSLAFSAGSTFALGHSGTSTTCTAMGQATCTITAGQFVADVASGLTVGRGARLTDNGSNNSFIEISAEL
jgi:hypothetical protein